MPQFARPPARPFAEALGFRPGQADDMGPVQLVGRGRKRHTPGSQRRPTSSCRFAPSFGYSLLLLYSREACLLNHTCAEKQLLIVAIRAGQWSAQRIS